MAGLSLVPHRSIVAMHRRDLHCQNSDRYLCSCCARVVIGASGFVALARACRALPLVCTVAQKLQQHFWTRRASSVYSPLMQASGVGKRENGAAGRKEQLCTGSDKLAQVLAKAYAANDSVAKSSFNHLATACECWTGSAWSTKHSHGTN